ncbi:ABC transporter ATP-binding protein [Consotaella aegiceratis]|uniref:ABC transporter ATP-binding protein n=1 Tax=Consotaella aegiceratis TaxID=3097961 RepID=UPI002F3E6B4B
MIDPVLDMRDLQVDFVTEHGLVPTVRGASLSIMPGETLALVGESGSGKTTAAMAAMGLLAPNARIGGGRISLTGHELIGAGRRELRALRGTAMAMIFQNPRAALNPVRPIGRQIADPIRAHRGLSRAEARRRAIELLAAVRFREPERSIDTYPHQLSGGMCQRAMIAMAIACEPKLLIADEPTTGLDTTTQTAVMALLRDLIQGRGMGMLLITHDLALAAQYADRVAVMRQGEIVEAAPALEIFRAPRQAYTRALVAATPTRESEVDDLRPEALPARPAPVRRPGDGLLLDVQSLSKQFDGATAVDGVSFTMEAGESLGLVGESGSGKSTISRLVCRLADPSGGTILFKGEDIGGIAERDFHRSPMRRDIQLVFQDPTDSINPRFSAFAAIADPLRRLQKLRGRALRARVEELARQVNLPQELLDRKPHQLSGGQKARVGIARAISVSPSLLVLDEPTTALDVSVQAIILHLLERLKRELGLSYLFISHDLNVVKMMCDRTIVLRAGKIVEQASSRDIFEAARDPYTRQLVDAVPHLDRRVAAADEHTACTSPIASVAQ